MRSRTRLQCRLNAVYCFSIAAPHFLQARCRFPSSRTWCPDRVGSEQCGQITITFETSIGFSRSRIPPWIPLLVLALLWRFTMLTPSMITFLFLGCTSITRPFLPLSFPAITTTRSFFLTLISTFIAVPSSLCRLGCELTRSSDDLGREADDLHESAVAQFSSDRTKHSSTYRLIVRFYDHRGILIEADIGSVLASGFFPRSNDDRSDHLAFLDSSVRRRFLDRGGYHIAESGSRAGMSSYRQNHRYAFRPGVVSNFED